MRLSELQTGEEGWILKVRGRGAFRKRITEMGFVVGKQVKVVRRAPLGDPIVYSLMGYEVSLRGNEAMLVEVSTGKPEALIHPDENVIPARTGRPHRNQHEEPGDTEKIIHVAFVGNPNSGKTTLFNFASHSRERVGNYSGVTIAAKEARYRLDGYTFSITDLPGTYSLTAYSPEEMYVREHITEAMPDVVVNVVDTSNLERNLYLTTQLIDMDIRTVVALNMYDELEKAGNQLDYKMLGDMTGIPFVPTVGSKGKGVVELFRKIIEVYEEREPSLRHIHIPYGREVESWISRLQELLNRNDNTGLTSRIAPRFIALKLLEKDPEITSRVLQMPDGDEITKLATEGIRQTEKLYGEDSETHITDARYGFIDGALRVTYRPARVQRVRRSHIIDNIIAHRIWGIPIFVAIMWLTFFLTFRIGEYPMAWIETGVNLLSSWLHGIMPPGMLRDLFIDGLIGGMGGVLIFLPNIIILYLAISFMEDTGYMARAVFIMDKAMHRIGLHGKSFIPLVMGFGCNVPAILSTRIIESRRDRLLTILINPFMSCSARLPVYVLIISAFFKTHQGTILFAIYLIGVLMAVITALLLQKLFFRKQDVPFVMELPPYRIPTARSMVRHMWHRTEQYLRKITTVILVASVIIWALGYFPMHKELPATLEHRIAELEQAKDTSQEAAKEYGSLVAQRSALLQEQSYIGKLGKSLHPVMEPLGFDWKMSVALLTGIMAKEVIVGTMGVLYEAGEGADAQSQSLIDKLQNYTYLSGPDAGKPVITPLAAFAFMMFILIYFPCVGVVAAIRKETGSWKWPAFSVFYTTGLAWLIAFIVYQGGLLFF
ncbi:MAG TPA: ferrous iron transport protein B [Bacteroidales bacterium]|nr:ferrous iron transport protein B [Bacteroidales bacterium]